MSGSSSSGAPSGVVQNSALSFVASAQPMQSSPVASVNFQEENRDEMGQGDRLMPAGLKALCEACSRLYPDQPNPLQVTTRLKYWLGGHDPLDYISMYWNPGVPDENVPPHWHYISFGMSDLHGDGRVHPPPSQVLCSSPCPPPSGFGIELTFRLSCDEAQPPLWPAALLQALARYVFTTGNKFLAGDHVSWHRALDGSGKQSRVRHLLVSEDPQLKTIRTPHGAVTFLQMVGCTGRELRAAQRGSGFDVLKLIGEDPNCGGKWLVTSVKRRVSARRTRVSRHSTTLAQLAGVSARVRWETIPQETSEESCPSPIGSCVEQQIKETLQRGLTTMTAERTGPEGHMSTDSFEMSSIERALPHVGDSMQNSWRDEDSVEYFDGVHIILNAEGASLLPLAIEGRVLQGSHFTWREGGTAVTVLPPTVNGALATLQKPYAARGSWLQVVIPKELALDISRKVSSLSRLCESDSETDSDEESLDTEIPVLPLTISCGESFKITVLRDCDML
ncbi:hypothetical protein K1T71_014344 [Dendrolimus kikuchii]|uniref:Uncharacterized protein n=1 Tax=Dendrolimus kikuchii TaxID=765133 RepID=A0ACC1CE00_9NEOP|nr:hypothetical protein K1T71_014344 [Dendrolimus kikuchii]